MERLSESQFRQLSRTVMPRPSMTAPLCQGRCTYINPVHPKLELLVSNWNCVARTAKQDLDIFKLPNRLDGVLQF
jgi:hypothetical protein